MKKIVPIIVMLSLAVGCSEDKSDPKTAAMDNLIKSGKWEEAKKSLESGDLQSISDHDVLLTYIAARYDYDTQKKNGKIVYEAILKELNTIDLDTYSGKYKEEIVAFKNSFNEERLSHYDNVEKQQQQKWIEDQKLQDESERKEIERALKNNDFNKISEMTLFGKYNREDYAALYNYANARLQQGKDNDLMIFYLNEIPPNYSGYASDVIMKFKLSLKSKGAWEQMYNEQQQLLKVIDKEKEVYEPQIGMTGDEVRHSSWGEPEDINKTTTKYSVSEQWVYDDFKYIYLEDGIVTAIQE